MKRIALVQIGIGVVGGEVVEQVLANRQRWRDQLGLDLRIAAIAERGGAVTETDPDGLAPDVLRAAVRARRAGQRLRDAFPERALVPIAEVVAGLRHDAPAIVLDAAAGERTAPLLARALAAGAGVVLSNKAPLALPLANPLAAQLWQEAGSPGRLRYEATCGAGLPVISTLRTLLDTGDRVIEIQGALSGTLGVIFNDIATGQTFSQAVRSAKERGYTEPDPRDDLSGLDVARKALILARTIGRQVDLDEIAVESLVPAPLRDVSVAEFLEQASVLDDEMAAREATARNAGGNLKYIASVPAEGPIAVGIRAVPEVGVLGALQGPENVVSMRTARYDAYPLAVAGPGAGAAVTAAGMLGDALTLAVRLARV